MKQLRKHVAVILAFSAGILIVTVMYSFGPNVIQISQVDSSTTSICSLDKGYVISQPALPTVFDSSVLNSLRRFQFLQHVLSTYSDSNRIIILSYIEYSYVKMAINLYVTSLKRFGINNYVMVSSDEASCEVLSPMGINCVRYAADLKASGQISRYGSDAFKERTHMKTKLVLDALKFEYTVIFTDLDIVYIKNPIPTLISESVGIDILIQREGTDRNVNSGFYIAKPTPESIYFFGKIVERESKSLKFSEQQVMVTVVEKIRKLNTTKIKFLSHEQFPSGNVYWENRKLMFPKLNPWESENEKAVIVHNNWIVGRAAKIYRFKETLMWQNDQHGYYSNPEAKYIMFGNPYDGDQNTVIKMEENALVNALAIGFILNRTVILPTFHCYGCTQAPCQNAEGECSLLARYNIEKFDNKFDLKYREHMFLQNKKVPESIRNFEAKKAVIMGGFVRDQSSKGTLSVHGLEYVPASSKGATVDEIVTWFGENSDPILNCYCLYDSFEGFPNSTKYTTIKDNLKTGLSRSGYRQY